MGVVTHEEYQRICERLAREAAVFAARMAADEEPADDPDALREHWIDVFLDEHLPDIDPDTLLAVSANADAWLKGLPEIKELAPNDDAAAAGEAWWRKAPAPIRAVAAFQADVWDAIDRTDKEFS